MNKKVQETYEKKNIFKIVIFFLEKKSYLYLYVYIDNIFNNTKKKFQIFV